MTQTITIFCDEIDTNGTFRYSPPPGFPQSGDCESTWYAQNGTVLGHGISLIQHLCVTGLQLVIRCFESAQKYMCNFQATNRTISGDDVGNKLVHLFWLPVIVLLVLLIVYSVYRKCIHSSEHDGDNTDHQNDVAVTSPMNNNTGENDEESQAS